VEEDIPRAEEVVKGRDEGGEEGETKRKV